MLRPSVHLPKGRNIRLQFRIALSAESVLERILQIWIEPGLVEKLRSLQMPELPLQRSHGGTRHCIG